MKVLLWRRWGSDGEQDSQLRVLGVAQIDTGKEGSDSDTSLRIFIGGSCSNTWTQSSTTLSESRPPTRKQHSHCFFYESTHWDNENNCFSHDPSLQQHDTGYEDSPLQESSCFQIIWEVERNLNQRSLSHVAMDTEGVRSGKMEIQVPYFLAGQQISETFSSLCDDKSLQAIIEKLM